jgi:UDP-GlcNAc:undecaprenyl-phosphate GlcNAc-1-phosphate transferase
LCIELIFGVVFTKINIIFVVSLILLISGLIDDLKELTILQKFFVQSFCAFLLIVSGIRTNIVYIGLWGNIVVTYLWIVGITNAFNHLDIIDGLAAGAAFIVCAAFFVIASFGGYLQLQFIMLLLGAAILGFLVLNLPPAKIYLGNSGSHFLGFILAGSALITSYATLERSVALVSPVIIFGLPIVDTLFLILFRAEKGIVPFRKSNDHIALRLVSHGLGRKYALFAVLAFSLFFAVSGIVVSRSGNLLGSIIVLSDISACIILFNILKRVKVNG